MQISTNLNNNKQTPATNLSTTDLFNIHLTVILVQLL